MLHNVPRTHNQLFFKKPFVFSSLCASVSYEVAKHSFFKLPFFIFATSILYYVFCVCQPLSRVQLFMIPWAVACQAPLSMEFSRQEYWSGLPFSIPGDLPDPGIKLRSPALQADSLQFEPQGKNYVSTMYPTLTFSTFFSSVQFSRSVVSDSLRPHESQHARPPCPSPTPGVHSDSHPLSQ